MKNYRIKIEFDVTKSDLEDYLLEPAETLGDVERAVVKLFENDYQNVECNIRELKDEERTNA